MYRQVEPSNLTFSNLALISPSELSPHITTVLKSPMPGIRASWWLSSKEFSFNAENTGSVYGLGRSPGERNGNPLQY